MATIFRLRNQHKAQPKPNKHRKPRRGEAQQGDLLAPTERQRASRAECRGEYGNEHHAVGIRNLVWRG